MKNINFADVIWQLVNLGLLILIVYLIVSFIRSYIKRGKQRKEMEQKINELSERIKDFK